jgi:hypothetical protein
LLPPHRPSIRPFMSCLFVCLRVYWRVHADQRGHAEPVARTLFAAARTTNTGRGRDEEARQNERANARQRGEGSEGQRGAHLCVSCALWLPGVRLRGGWSKSV